MTKSQFHAQAKPVSVVVGGVTLQAAPKTFSTGSVGFYLNGKVQVTLADGAVVSMQVSGNLTAIGSKEWAQ